MIEERLNIVIPTRNRFAKLVETLKTIPQYSWMELHLGFDGDRRSFESFSRMDGYWKGAKANLFFSPVQIGAIKMRNILIQHSKGAILWATDDILFLKGGIESAWKNLWDRFPDGDGVVGFMQSNAKPAHNFCWTGVGIMGETFLLRYPEKMISFPEYFHFGTREIETLAVKLNKLYKDNQARIFHNHPDFYPAQMDTTHLDARVFQDRDVALKKARKKAGLIWGDGNERSETYRSVISGH